MAVLLINGLVALVAAGLADLPPTSAALDHLWSACTSPPLASDACGFYDKCLEATHECGSKGYALGYGLKYCERFDNSTRQCASKKGNHWINSTLACLQESLVPLLDANETCDAIKMFAFNSHPKCYTGGGKAVPRHPSICMLPLSDWTCVIETIDARDALSPLGLLQEAKVADICAMQWHNLTGDASCDSDDRCQHWRKRDREIWKRAVG